MPGYAKTNYRDEKRRVDADRVLNEEALNKIAAKGSFVIVRSPILAAK